MQPSIPWKDWRNGNHLSLKCTVLFSLVVPMLSLAVTHCYLLSLVVTLCIIPCHSLSLVAPLVVTRCTPRCHSLHHSLSLVVIRCHSLYHSLSIVVIRCHSLSFDVPFVCLFINDQIFIQHWRQNVSQWIKIKNVTSSKSLALS